MQACVIDNCTPSLPLLLLRLMLQHHCVVHRVPRTNKACFICIGPSVYRMVGMYLSSSSPLAYCCCNCFAVGRYLSLMLMLYDGDGGTRLRCSPLRNTNCARSILRKYAHIGIQAMNENCNDPPVLHLQACWNMLGRDAMGVLLSNGFYTRGQTTCSISS